MLSYKAKFQRGLINNVPGTQKAPRSLRLLIAGLVKVWTIKESITAHIQYRKVIGIGEPNDNDWLEIRTTLAKQ
jgi:hypothetical protein